MLKRTKNIRKVLSLFVVICILFTSVPTSTWAEIVSDTDSSTGIGNLLLSLSMDNELEGISGGTGKATFIGATDAATLTLTEDSVSGKALKLNGDGALQVTNTEGGSLLGELEEFTVSYWSKISSDGTNWTTYIAKDETVPVYLSESYIAIRDANKIFAERYNVGRTLALETNTTMGEWKHVLLSVGKTTTSLYVDGKLATEGERDNAALQDIIGNESIFWIGKSNWGTGEYCKGIIDEYRVYDRAVDAVGAETIYWECADLVLLKKAVDEISIPELDEFGNKVNASNVQKLTLVDSIGDASVTWSSGNVDVVSNDGTIIAPNEVTEVSLTATLTLKDASDTVTFKFKVYPQGKYPYSIEVLPENEGVDISEEIVGLFFEDINEAADGGLYPEMVKNYSFENYFCVQSSEEPSTGRGTQYSWKLHWESNNADNFVVVQDTTGVDSLNVNNCNFAQITGNMILKNGGFAVKVNPNVASMPIEKDEKYDFSMWVKAAEGYAGTMNIKVVNSSDSAITDEKEITIPADGTWQKVEDVLTGNKTESGKLILTISGAQDTDVLNIDMISLSPRDTYGYGNKNYSYGKGVRADLVEKLYDIKPNFIRFPGGCIIEGNSGRDSYYNWENSIGPLEERKPIANPWGNWLGSDYETVYDTVTYGYMQSFGFGYHEMLTLCEDLGAEPFPILSAGVFCQNANYDGTPAATGEELDKFANHVTHLIDYCWGSVDSTNETQKKWAQKRVDNGHEAPFDLNYVGVGNENWYDKYLNNFKYIKEYVEEYVANNYPERKITIISSTGDMVEGNKIDHAWYWLNSNMPGQTLVDEHYYVNENHMLNKDYRYDFYNRLENGGSEVFLGEYATHLTNGKKNTLESAICDAAYFTGIERNGDIVRHASYAPLFQKIGCTYWSSTLIHFDQYGSVETPNYYVQKMFSENIGNKIIKTNLEKEDENYTDNLGSPILATSNTAGYVTNVKVTREDGTVLLDEKFDGTSGITWEPVPGYDGGFTIEDGKLVLNQAEGMNAVWIKEAVENPEWHDYKVEATVVKTAGNEGFIVGAGAISAEDFYCYNIGAFGNNKTYVQLYRNGSSEIIGYTESSIKFSPVNTNEEMYVTFNYGVDDKLEAGYTTEAMPNRAKDMSANLRPYQNDIYQVCSKDDDYIYLKLVNHDTYSKSMNINFGYELISDEAEIISMTGSADAINEVGQENVKPTTTTKTLSESTLSYNIPAMSVNVIKVKIGDDSDDADKVVANEVSDKIAAIGTVEDTVESKTAIDNAREAYDSLTNEQKRLVTNRFALTTAEAEYNVLTADTTASEEPEEPKEYVETITYESAQVGDWIVYSGGKYWWNEWGGYTFAPKMGYMYHNDELNIKILAAGDPVNQENWLLQVKKEPSSGMYNDLISGKKYIATLTFNSTVDGQIDIKFDGVNEETIYSIVQGENILTTEFVYSDTVGAYALALDRLPVDTELTNIVLTFVEVSEELLTVTVDGEKIDVNDGTVTLGDADLGYYCTTNKKMYKANSIVNVEEDMAFVTADLSITATLGAGIRLTDPTGIRFRMTIASQNISIDELQTAEIISEGTIITTNDYFKYGGVLTLNSSYSKVVIPNSGWHNNKEGVYCGSLVNIKESNYIREFIAVGYLTIKYEDGEEKTVYSNMTNARSVKWVAQAIIDTGRLSNYTDAQQVLINNFATAK